MSKFEDGDIKHQQLKIL